MILFIDSYVKGSYCASNLLSKETSAKVGKKAMQRFGRVPRLEATASRS
jgi:hypothetical protein